MKSIYEELSSKYTALLNNQRIELEAEIGSKLAESRQLIEKGHYEKILALKSQFMKEMEDALVREKTRLETEKETELNLLQSNLKSEHQVHLKELSLNFEEKLTSFLEAQAGEMNQLKENVNSVYKVLETQAEK